MKLTFSNIEITLGMIPISRSTPFRYYILDINTIFITPGLFFNFRLGFGLNLSVSTAFGMMKILLGSDLTRKKKFSLHVWLTAIAASSSRYVHLLNLLRFIPAAL